ncbi:MAG: response regulator [Pseudomonadota bacterium]
MTEQDGDGALGPCIVVIDDDPMDRHVLIRSLKEIDETVEVIEVSDPRQAVQTIDERTPVLALLDIQMPMMSGFDVLIALGGRSAPPVMMLSSSAYVVDRDRAMKLGASAYHVKPSSLDGYRALANDIRSAYSSRSDKIQN